MLLNNMTTTKKIVYVDMDGVIADFDAALIKLCPDINTILDPDVRSMRVDRVCEENYEIFHNLPPIKGGIEGVNLLANSSKYDVYFLSTPMWNVPHSFIGKRLWIRDHFGEWANKRLILSHRKDLNIGDYLIDDRLKNGAGEFRGTHIHFGTPKFPDWKAVIEYLLPDLLFPERKLFGLQA
jgi:5'-nucleotidase